MTSIDALKLGRYASGHCIENINIINFRKISFFHRKFVVFITGCDCDLHWIVIA